MALKELPVSPLDILESAHQALRSDRADDALSTLRDALPTLAQNPAHLAIARSIEGQALVAVHRGGEALDVLDLAIADAATAGLRREVNALQTLKDQLRGMIATAAIAAIPIEELEERASNPAQFAALLMQKAVASANAYDGDAARLFIVRARAAADASGQPLALLEVLVNAAQILDPLGDIEAARSSLDEARPIALEHAPDLLATIEALNRRLADP